MQTPDGGLREHRLPGNLGATSSKDIRPSQKDYNRCSQRTVYFEQRPSACYLWRPRVPGERTMAHRACSRSRNLQGTESQQQVSKGEGSRKVHGPVSLLLQQTAWVASQSLGAAVRWRPEFCVQLNHSHLQFPGSGLTGLPPTTDARMATAVFRRLWLWGALPP